MRPGIWLWAFQKQELPSAGRGAQFSPAFGRERTFHRSRVAISPWGTDISPLAQDWKAGQRSLQWDQGSLKKRKCSNGRQNSKYLLHPSFPLLVSNPPSNPTRTEAQCVSVPVKASTPELSLCGLWPNGTKRLFKMLNWLNQRETSWRQFRFFNYLTLILRRYAEIQIHFRKGILLKRLGGEHYAFLIKKGVIKP